MSLTAVATPTPTQRAIQRLPAHLRRFVVDQIHEAYTPRDHAVWRHILRQLTERLKDTAHASYLSGLAATGIGLDRIPSLDEMNEKLETLGWCAVGVRGFIPPAVFTELQSLGVLAVAADIRSHEHLEYTPAPDIVHESAGHAPILADHRYAEYLKRCGEVGFRAIASVEDQAVYEAIRNLSVVKEDPAATEEELRLAQERLSAASASRRYVSESTKASRLYWWTAEYGLVGALSDPKLYGAGLLSSLGEAAHCLTDAVRKVPLSLVCADTEYDITRMQPQLFVARDFDHLFEVLEAFEATLGWRRGGDHGLEEALRARTVNHLVLDGGLELTGKVVARIPSRSELAPGLRTALARVEGPIQISRQGQALDRPWPGEALVAFGSGALPHRGAFSLDLPSGLFLTGFRVGEHEVINLRGHQDGRPLDLPSWALLFLSGALPSVAGGPADPGSWDQWFGDHSALAEGEAEAQARDRKAAALPMELADLYVETDRLRRGGSMDLERLNALRERAMKYPGEWLLQAELAALEALS
ncbi:aromatic amino acid hydroxylase [Geothrix sp. PMB-07]|uniref:aromatic amino acid hydroxylase n=1 Tax=Geothrix sp. PMB-07 TaxID=3068640 RepID=UPI0027404643|nr:aromatic amino acid hydroxylase [Geothrix sp. PMB-07]WLT30187.1 aromatic amino acid hydroxylase [Geothrix sp. PMB-07]